MVTCYSDADWRGDKEDRISTTRYLFQVFVSLISWCSRKQLVVALSSCEAEYIVGRSEEIGIVDRQHVNHKSCEETSFAWKK